MCAYRLDLEREIKAASKKVDQLVEQLSNNGGTQAADFTTKWSEILSLRQSIQAKQQRINGIGKSRPFLPQFISIDKYTKR